MIRTYLAVIAAGAAGTGARMFLSTWLSERIGSAFPWGTFAVNVTGCFVIGAFSGLTGPSGPLLTSPLTRQVVMIGFLGGFTTFSSFSLQTLMLLGEGQRLYAFGNVFLSLALCLAGTWAGLVLAGLWTAK